MRSLFLLLRQRSLAVSLVLLAGLAASGVAQTVQLRLVSTSWPPFTNPSGQPRLALDLVEAALGRAGLNSSTSFVDASRYTPALLGNGFDGSAAAWRDPSREKVLLYSEPYLENRLILVGRKGADVSATRLAALKGRRIALVEGYSYGSEVESAGPSYVRSSSEEDSLRQLLDSKVEFALMDALVVQYIVEQHADQARERLQLGDVPLIRRPLHLAINRSRLDADSVITKFNAQLRGLIADRTYHKLLQVDWIQADVDGDGLSEYVPRSDQAGTLEPQRVYAISTGNTSSTTPVTEPRFYVGGNIYTSWASVPSSYKVVGVERPDARRSTASIFKFVW